MHVSLDLRLFVEWIGVVWLTGNACLIQYRVGPEASWLQPSAGQTEQHRCQVLWRYGQQRLCRREQGTERHPLPSKVQKFCFLRHPGQLKASYFITGESLDGQKIKTSGVDSGRCADLENRR
jgi:hypothetical protein